MSASPVAPWYFSRRPVLWYFVGVQRSQRPPPLRPGAPQWGTA